MPWRKREIREEDVRRFVATFEGKAKFLVDESFGVEAARVIRDLGWDAEFVCDVALGGRPDEDVMAYAQRERRIILTHDRDFLDDRRFPPHRNPGVIVLPGANGGTEILDRELARLLITIGEHGEAYVGHKVHIRNDGMWSIRHSNAVWMLKFDARGDIWELD